MFVYSDAPFYLFALVLHCMCEAVWLKEEIDYKAYLANSKIGATVL